MSVAYGSAKRLRRVVRARAVEPVVCSQVIVDAALLEQETVGKSFIGEHELALGMATHVLARLGSVRSPGH